jgi:hypothetical protein
MITALILCQVVRADPRLTKIDPQLLPDTKIIQAWHERKAAGIHSFTGSPSWLDYMHVVEAGLAKAGVMDVIRDRFTYTRWFTSDNPQAGKWSLEIGDDSIPVASYWAYSGSTGDAGITAPLVIYDNSLTPEMLQGKIVVFEVPGLSEPLPPMFQPAGYEFATDTDTLDNNRILSSDQWYQTNYVTRFGRLDAKLKKSGAAGALVIFSMGPERAAGLYTFPLLEPGLTGAPGLYLDRNAGERVKQAARRGESATLRLLAEQEEVEGYFYTGFLPGRDYGTDRDEYVLLITHSDGPNLSQDNGGFGVLSVVQYFANIAQRDRPKTLAIMLDPQHFTPHRHRDDWYEMHPEIVERIVATFGIEHLGQLEYTEKGDRFVQSGLPETTIIFAQDNDQLIAGAIDAVKAFALPRAMVQSPPRGGQGNWSGMSDVSVKKNYPGYGISTNMSAYWSTRAGIDTFDKELFRRQVGVAAQLTGVLMTLSKEEMSIPDAKTTSPGKNAAAN